MSDDLRDAITFFTERRIYRSRRTKGRAVR